MNKLVLLSFVVLASMAAVTSSLKCFKHDESAQMATRDDLSDEDAGSCEEAAKSCKKVATRTSSSEEWKYTRSCSDMDKNECTTSEDENTITCYCKEDHCNGAMPLNKSVLGVTLFAIVAMSISKAIN